MATSGPNYKLIEDLLIKAKTKESFERALQAGSIKSTSIVFIEDTEELWTHGKYYHFVPSNGKEGQILRHNGEKAEWSWNIEDLLSYGVEWDVNATNPTLTRIGNPAFHESLPILSLYKGCTVFYDHSTGLHVRYLNPNNWSYWHTDTSSDFSELSGDFGDVMVHIPKFYGKSGQKNGKNWVRISEYNIDGTWTEIPEMYVSAYKFMLYNRGESESESVSPSPKSGTKAGITSIASSVVNFSSNYSNGTGRPESYDSCLGVGTIILNMRASVRNKFNPYASLLNYEYYKWIFYWAFVIEYATFDCQSIFLGTWDSDEPFDVNAWHDYNYCKALVYCGLGNLLGNNSGIIDTSLADSIAEIDFIKPGSFRWRGFDNPFGDSWTFLDGIVVNMKSSTDKKVYTSTVPSDYDDLEKMNYVCDLKLNTSGYIKEFELGTNGDIIPKVLTNEEGAGLTGKCDYASLPTYQGSFYLGIYRVMVGGDELSGDKGGLATFALWQDPSANSGAKICINTTPICGYFMIIPKP